MRDSLVYLKIQPVKWFQRKSERWSSKFVSTHHYAAVYIHGWTLSSLILTRFLDLGLLTLSFLLFSSGCFAHIERFLSLLCTTFFSMIFSFIEEYWLHKHVYNLPFKANKNTSFKNIFKAFNSSNTFFAIGGFTLTHE